MQPQLRTLTGTASDDAITGPCDVWGVVIEGTTNATARINLHNNVSFTGTILVTVGTNTADGTNFEKYTGIMLPRPVRFTTALSATWSGTGQYWIYVAGPSSGAL